MEQGDVSTDPGHARELLQPVRRMGEVGDQAGREDAVEHAWSNRWPADVSEYECGIVAASCTRRGFEHLGCRVDRHHGSRSTDGLAQQRDGPPGATSGIEGRPSRG